MNKNRYNILSNIDENGGKKVVDGSEWVRRVKMEVTKKECEVVKVVPRVKGEVERVYIPRLSEEEDLWEFSIGDLDIDCSRPWTVDEMFPLESVDEFEEKEEDEEEEIGRYDSNSGLEHIS